VQSGLKRAEREAQKEEFRVKYTRAFPKFSFYLHWDISEGDPDARERLQTRIHHLDAVSADFTSMYFNADIVVFVLASGRFLFQR
jgi:hypothetical protein